MRAHFIYEKFHEKSDPIIDMGIGTDIPRTFDSNIQLNRWIIDHLPHILGTKKIPDDILKDEHKYLKPKYIDLINNYVDKYLRVSGLENNYPNWHYLNNELHDMGYKNVWS